MKTVAEGTLFMYKVQQTREGYLLTVKGEGGTVNEWNLGMDEAVAKGKVATLIKTYQDGLEYLQEQVRTAFEVKESAEQEGA